MSKTKKSTKVNVWDKACKLAVHRSSPDGIYTGNIDPGVNYFVLMLEQLGAVTQYSCEGHPRSFYVLFSAPMHIALDVLGCGYFTVELEGDNEWSIRLDDANLTEEMRVRILRLAAGSWDRRLGPLKFPKKIKNA